MITQFERQLTEVQGSPYNQAAEMMILHYMAIGYKFKMNRNQMLDDYIASPKVLFTSVVPQYQSPYDEEVIELAMSLGWKFVCCGRLYTELEQFSYDRKRTNWGLCWKWDIVWPLGIKDMIVSNKENNAKTAFIGYRMDEVIDMNVADYSGTCIDASEFTKQFCDYVSDRSFNNFAFSELLLAIVEKDVKVFIEENVEKYFEKIS